MKKKILIILLTLIFCIGIDKVYAYTYSLSASSTSVTVGSNVTVTLKTNDVMGFYQVTSSNGSVLAGSGGDSIDSGDPYTKTFTFTAKGAGSATITVSPTGSGLNVYSTEETLYSRSVTINVVEKSAPQQIEVNKTYSKNNYLKSLSVEGYDISFNKDTLDYKIDLLPGTESVTIKATPEDDKANVKGKGDVSVSEGTNTVNIVVVAENGNERTYTLTLNVDEKDPILVKLNDKEYRVVKKESLIGDKSGYEKTKVKINDFEIPALYNDITKVTLVGLKDKEGNIELFSYDSKTGKYSEYKEFTFDVLSLYVMDTNFDKYDKTKIKINGNKVDAYKIPGVRDYYLLYGINTTTGHKGYYLFDSKENSIQRYDDKMLDAITKEKDKYLSLVIVLSCVCFLTMLFLLIEVNKEQKLKRED